MYYCRQFVQGKPGSGATTSIDQLLQTSFVKKTTSGSIICSAQAMGRDPLPGYYKFCFCDPVAYLAESLV